MNILSFIGIFMLSSYFMNSVDGLATMSIDLGSEFMKVAIVKPGVPMEIALDSDSSRKTPTIVGIRNGERVFGTAAASMSIKFPESTYQFFPNLLGKSTSHPDVQMLLKNFPYYKFEDDIENGQLYYLHEKEKYTVEEITAMILEKARETAEKSSGFPIKGAVITVPPYFSQASRRALLRAAKLCDLNVLQLINDNSAVALNYGVFRYKTFNSTSQYYIFYDMGSMKTTATLVEYKTVRHREIGSSIADEVPQLMVLGVGFDSTLGAVPLALRLRDHLAKKFDENAKLTGDKSVVNNHRAMAKLFKESLRVMRVLSANLETTAQVENVMNDIDFKLHILRSDFYNMCKDLIERVTAPLTQALTQAQLPIASIQEVILMGGGTRIPFVQEVLTTAIGNRELGKSINSDEAAALGAVYQAAHLTPGFRVKRFLIRDANLFPIQVSFLKSTRGEEKATSESQTTITRTVFTAMNVYPQRKSLTFNKHNENFDFTVFHDSLDHIAEEERGRVPEQICQVRVKGVVEAHKKHVLALMDSGSAKPSNEEAASDNATAPETLIKVEPKGVKAHFELSESGLLNLRYIEALFEKSPAAIKLEEEKNESTLSKIGSTISNFFSGSSSNTKNNDTEPVLADQPNNVTSNSDKPSSDNSSVNATAGDKNSTDGTAAASSKEPAKPVIVSENLLYDVVYVDRAEPSANSVKTSMEIIRKLREADMQKRAFEQSRNDLEAFLFETRDRLESSEYEKCSTPQEKEKLLQSLNEARDWYEEQGMDTPKYEFDSRLSSLKTEVEPIQQRVQELRQRPEAFARLKDALNTSEVFYKSAINFTAPPNNIFTQTEVDLLGNVIYSTKDWWKEKQVMAQAMDLTQKPTVTVEEINQKGIELHRELQYLLTKINIWKNNPPPPPPPPKSTLDDYDQVPTFSDEDLYGKDEDFQSNNQTTSTSESPEDDSNKKVEL